MVNNKSTHQAEVIELNFEKLEGSDNLSVMNVFGGYTVVGNTTEWAGKTRACYIVPDTLVDTKRPEFAWLASQARSDGYYRVTAKKFNKFGGIISCGLLCPVSEETPIGTDMWETLGLRRYEPDENGEIEGLCGMGGEVASGPNIYNVSYDVDSLQRWGRECFSDGELVLVTEKIHGCLREDTLIQTLNSGQKRIKDLIIGEEIISYNLQYNRFEKDKVCNKLVQDNNPNIQWYEIQLENGQVLVITSNHQILTERGWVSAENLLDSDEIISY